MSTSSIAQTTYYIDATNGLDTNNGLTVETTWKTINKVNQQSFSAGDNILFKRGEIWYGTRLEIDNVSGAINNHIIFGAYGTGAKPVISSVMSQSHTWTNVSDNLWTATNPPVINPQRLLINGTERLRSNIESELDGTNYYWMYDDSSNNLYVYSTINPNTLSFEYSVDFPVIIGWAEYITIKDLDIQGGWTGVFITTASKNLYLYNLDIGKYCRNGIVISSSSTSPSNYPQNVLIDDCLFDSHFAFDYSTSTTYNGNSSRGCSDGYLSSKQTSGQITNCEFKNWGHASINLNGTEVTNVSINNNYLTAPDICYGGRLTVDDASAIEVFNNKIYNTSITSQLNGQNNHYHHNIFNGTKDSPLKPDINAGVGIQGYASSTVKENVYENNLFIDIEGAAFKISGNNVNNIHDNIFRNNTIYNCGSLVNDESIIVEENLFQQTYDNAFQNNLIFNSSTTQTCNFRGNIYNIYGFNSQSGSDGYLMSSNISGDPLFLDSSNNDYHLNSNSPCINSGILTLATTDFEGYTIPYNGTNPDIGIYEFQSTLSIDTHSVKEKIMILPNPSNGLVTILGNDRDIKNIKLTNTNGQIVLTNILINETIDLSYLLNGVYFIMLETSYGMVIKRVVLMQ